MEGKNVMMMSGLLVVVVLGQIQVGAARICCPTAFTTRAYKICLATGTPQTICAQQTGCTVSDAAQCPNRLTNEIRENTSSVNEYCKLGCVSSVCGAITTLQHSDASEVVNGAVEKCIDACSALCTKGAVQTA